MKNLDNFFKPKSVAIIGASDKNGSIGNTIAKNASHYNGKVFFINPRLADKKLLSKKVFSSVLDITDPIDLAVVAVPATVSLPVIKEIAKKKIKNVLMITSGFSDITREIKKIIDKEKINLIGPNCLGIMDFNNNLDLTFNAREKYDLPKKGRVSIITQSGALGLAILDLASKEQLEINRFVSYGNAIDIDECDLLKHLEKDKETDIILCYVEGIANGKRFFETIKKVSPKKKVIVIKGGVTDNGTTAVRSHTAAIAGASKIFSAAVLQAEAKEVKTIKEMFNLAKFYSWYNVSKIKNTQIITNGGGFGVLTTDKLSLQKINLAEMQKTTKEKIKKIVPIYASVGNPTDLTGDADDERFVKVIECLLEDKNISSISVLMLLQIASISNKIPEKIAKLKAKTKKPIMIVTIGGKKTERQLENFEKRKVLCFRDPSELSDILKYLK